MKKTTVREVQDLLSQKSLEATKRYLNAEVMATEKETPKNDASSSYKNMETIKKYLKG